MRHGFSKFEGKKLNDVTSLEDPDEAIIMWMDQEEMLFKTLEKHIVQDKIKAGFDDVDSFIKFSLSVHNRRESRGGFALENHLEQVFVENKVRFSRGKVTENKSKPDFLFPDITSYHNPNFPSFNLTMLGVKSTCKDRWRQVLSEAQRIENKHLLTLEPAISVNQTLEMQANKLQLVVPESIHETYHENQRIWLLNLNDFVRIVSSKETS